MYEVVELAGFNKAFLMLTHLALLFKCFVELHHNFPSRPKFYRQSVTDDDLWFYWALFTLRKYVNH